MARPERKRKITIAIAAIAFCFALGAGYGIWAWLQWEPYDGKATGVIVSGDPKMAPTGGLLHNAWMKFFGWKTVVVLEVDEESARIGYRFGYRPYGGGPAKLHTDVHHVRRIKARVGFEAPTFILVRTDGKMPGVEVVDRTTKDDPAYADVPLM